MRFLSHALEYLTQVPNALINILRGGNLLSTTYLHADISL